LGAAKGGFGREGWLWLVPGDPARGVVSATGHGSRLTMVLTPLRTLLFSCVTASLTATATLAQDANYVSIDATSDKPVQLSYHASAHKNCTPAPQPTIRVIEAPKKGTLTVRRGVLTTERVAGCPGLKTPVQVVFYLARPGYAGPDHVKYEMTTENGEVATYDVTIAVKAAPAQTPPATGDRPL